MLFAIASRKFAEALKNSSQTGGGCGIMPLSTADCMTA
jgi:hypothetical protein